MPRYLCKRDGKNVSGELHVDGREVIRDLNRIWYDCIVSLDGVQQEVEAVYAYKETPVMVLVPTGGGEAMLVTLDHPKLTIEYPELGYFNLPTSAIYAERKVSRQWKQGLHANTCAIRVPFTKDIGTRTSIDPLTFTGIRDRGERTGAKRLISSLPIYNPTYPTYEQAINTLLENRALSVALNRDILLALHPINGEVHIMYHELSVGAIDVDRDALIVRPEFNWLYETLRGVIRCQE